MLIVFSKGSSTVALQSFVYIDKVCFLYYLKDHFQKISDKKMKFWFYSLFCLILSVFRTQPTPQILLHVHVGNM